MTNTTQSIEDMRDAWRTERQHEAQLSEALVHDIAWRLVQSGHQPTAAAVRKVHGGGSPNLIHPALHSFFAGELQDRWVMPADTDVPEPLMALWRACIKAARETANEAIATTRKELSEREKALDERESVLGHQADVMEVRQRESDKRIQDLRRRLAQTLRNERSFGKQRESLMNALERARTQGKEAETELGAARQTLAERQHKLDTLTEKLTAETHARTTAEEQTKRSKEDVIAQTKKNADLSAQAENLGRRIEGLTQNLDTLTVQRDEVKTELAKATEAADMAQQKLSAEIRRLASQLAESQAEKAGAENERDRLRKDRDAALQTAADERKQYQGMQAALDTLTRELKAQSKAKKKVDRPE